ncbi:MAG: SLBB domain-containing protein [candidate division WOR-3 bacterium]
MNIVTVSITILLAGIPCGSNSGDGLASITASASVRTAVWGQVNNPGLYYLPGTPDVLELISSAGGPAPGADLSRVLLIRELDRSRTYLNLGRLTAQAEPVFLAPGDVVVVPESFWSRIQRNLPIISTVATVVNLAITITLVSRK